MVDTDHSALPLALPLSLALALALALTPTPTPRHGRHGPLSPTLSPNETPTPTPNTYPLKMNQVKTGHVAAFSEKRISCSINTWIRGPGICAFCTICVPSLA